jgi:hypothetical protein
VFALDRRRRLGQRHPFDRAVAVATNYGPASHIAGSRSTAAVKPAASERGCRRRRRANLGRVDTRTCLLRLDRRCSTPLLMSLSSPPMDRIGPGWSIRPAELRRAVNGLTSDYMACSGLPRLDHDAPRGGGDVPSVDPADPEIQQVRVLSNRLRAPAPPMARASRVTRTRGNRARGNRTPAPSGIASCVSPVETG